MNKIVGIIDEPVAPGSTDNLDINVHSKSLIDFMTDTSTPITVGIQGEWGSGKTSLINSIHHAFDAKQNVKQIWINSWEYSLLSTPEETLLKIVTRIIDDLTEADTNQKRITAIKGGAEKIFKGALRAGVGMTMGTAAADVAQELLESSSQTISALRKQLKEVVNEMASRPSNPYEKVIVYVDDLDRIEPKNAVAILELLKNIFSVPKCVFVLAIDYQVVVKGLEHKFGPQTPENEWEFRAFFDKIIQLPFMMPMGQYNIGKYVNSLLLDIGFVNGEGLDDEAVREIVKRTIGGNPRSIKRLANSVSLIQIFIENKSIISGTERIETDDADNLTLEEEKFLLFSLLCLQIAYPAIYSFLTQNPDFSMWSDNDAFIETKRAEEDTEGLFKKEFENACKTDDFNEEWEQVLFRICYIRPRLRLRVADISKFFSYLKDEILNEKQEIIGSSIANILTQTSVTSVSSTDQGQIQSSAQSKNNDEETVSTLRDFRNSYLDSIKKAGSTVYGSRSGGKSFSWYMRFRAKKNFFSEPKFLPRWQIGFFWGLSIRIDGKTADEHQNFIRFFEANLSALETGLGREYGQWSFFRKDGVIRKQVTFSPIDDLILPKGVLDGLSFEDSGPFFAKNPDYRKNAIEWGCHCVPIFEKLMIEYCEKFISENPGTVESPIAYGG